MNWKNLSDAKKPHYCQKCGNRGIYRNGVYFDHMMRCPTCETTWVPYEIEQKLILEKNKRIKEHENSFGGGI